MNNVEKYIIQLQDKFSGPMKNATDSAGGLEKKMFSVSKSMVKAGAIAAAAAVGLASIKIIQNGIKNYENQEQALAQVRQGLLTTGNVAGKTLNQLSDSASKLQANSLFGDEDILQNVTAQILTFTNIAGKQFDRVQQAALDVSTRLNGADASGESLKATSIMLGKALNDPVANLGALSRSGIQFSVSQKDVIKNLAETGRLAEAQALILSELEKQYGGSAKAAADASTGQKQFQNALGDLSEKIGKVFYPAVQLIYKGLSNVVQWLDRAGTSTFKFLQGAANKISGFFMGLGAVLENLDKRFDNTALRVRNLFFTATGQFKKVKEVEKVGESVAQAYQKGFEIGNKKFGNKKVSTTVSTIAAINDSLDPFLSESPTTTGKTSPAESQPTSITGSAPKVFNINVDKLIDGFTISTNNLTESATAIKEHVTRALAEALADIQTVAS